MIAPKIKSTRKSGKSQYCVFLERLFLLILKQLLRYTDQAGSHETFSNDGVGPNEEEKVETPGYYEEIIIAD